MKFNVYTYKSIYKNASVISQNFDFTIYSMVSEAIKLNLSLEAS